MRKKISILFILAMSAVGMASAFIHPSAQPVAFGFDQSQNVLPAQVKKVLDSGEKFVLFSIDPTHRPLGENPPPKERFHNYAILGKTEIRDKKEREELLSALYKGIGESEGLVARCFNPRHGIRVTLSDETVDLLICFECMSIQVYGTNQSQVLTTDSPQPTFNRALKKAGVRIAKD